MLGRDADVQRGAGGRCNELHMDAARWLERKQQQREHFRDGRRDGRDHFRDGNEQLRNVDSVHACSGGFVRAACAAWSDLRCGNGVCWCGADVFRDAGCRRYFLYMDTSGWMGRSIHYIEHYGDADSNRRDDFGNGYEWLQPHVGRKHAGGDFGRKSRRAGRDFGSNGGVCGHCADLQHRDGAGCFVLYMDVAGWMDGHIDNSDNQYNTDRSGRNCFRYNYYVLRNIRGEHTGHHRKRDASAARQHHRPNERVPRRDTDLFCNHGSRRNELCMDAAGRMVWLFQHSEHCYNGERHKRRGYGNRDE